MSSVAFSISGGTGHCHTESGSKFVSSSFSSKPSHAGPCHEMLLHLEFRMPGWLGTSHGDMATRSCVPLPALTAQPGSEEGHSRMAGKGILFAKATEAKSSHCAHKNPESAVSSCTGWEAFFWQHEGLNYCLTPLLHDHFWRVLCFFWNDADLPACRSGLEAAVGAERAHSALSPQDSLDVHVFKVQSQAPAGSKGHLCSQH